MCQKKIVEQVEANFLFLFFPENRAVCEMMWKKYGRTRQVTDNSTIRGRDDVFCLPANKCTYSYFPPHCC
jgi:hypothetical protein